MNSQELLQLEKELSFHSLTNEDLRLISMSIVQRIYDENLRPIRIRAILHGDVVFQYMMDGKTGEEWLNRKQRTVEFFKHSSYYVFQVNEETGKYHDYQDNCEFAICGGGFPLFVENQMVGMLIVSGLEHDKDHQLIVDALKAFHRRIAFASDIDGTLFFQNIDGNYKVNDLMKIKEFQQNGHLFGVCTGRPLCFIDNVKNLGMDFYIMSSGAVLLDKNFKIIEDYPMAYVHAQRIFEQYKDCSLIVVHTGNSVTCYGNKRENQAVSFIKIHSIDEIKDETLYGLSIVVESDEEASLIAQDINQQFKDLIGYQNKNSIDIVRRDCSKGIAVKRMKELLRVQKMAGIGDSYNDIALLSESDLSFTFQDCSDIHSEADEIVESVAEAIAKFMDQFA